MLSLGLSPDSQMSLRSRPLHAGRLFVRLSWSQPQPTETGGLTWNTTWIFAYWDQRGQDQWQHVGGSVVRDADGTERLDARERFARAIATRAGWELWALPVPGAPPALSTSVAPQPKGSRPGLIDQAEMAANETRPVVSA